MGLREKNKEDKRRRIHNAARRLFAKQGYAATTTRQIAEEAGVATGTLFLYCRDKEDLLLQLWQEPLSRVLERTFATLPPTGTLQDKLTYIFGEFFQHYAEEPEHSRIYLKETVFMTAEHRFERDALNQLLFEKLMPILQTAIESKELRDDVNLGQVLFNIFALYFLVLTAGVNGTVHTVEEQIELFRNSLELQFEGLRPE